MSATLLFATPTRIAYQIGLSPASEETILQSTLLAALPQGPLRNFLSKFSDTDDQGWEAMLSRPELRTRVENVASGSPGCFFSVSYGTTLPNAVVVGASGSAPGTGMLDIEYVNTITR